MEQKTAQLRAKPRVISQYGSGIFFETPERAQFLIATGQFELVNAGPSERKPAGAREKKVFSSTETAGPSTATARSSEHGTDASASVSQPGRASPLTNAGRSEKPKLGLPQK
jgi:hypothetical protein